MVFEKCAWHPKTFSHAPFKSPPFRNPGSVSETGCRLTYMYFSELASSPGALRRKSLVHTVYTCPVTLRILGVWILLYTTPLIHSSSCHELCNAWTSTVCLYVAYWTISMAEVASYPGTRGRGKSTWYTLHAHVLNCRDIPRLKYTSVKLCCH